MGHIIMSIRHCRTYAIAVENDSGSFDDTESFVEFLTFVVELINGWTPYLASIDDRYADAIGTYPILQPFDKEVLRQHLEEDL